MRSFYVQVFHFHIAYKPINIQPARFREECIPSVPEIELLSGLSFWLRKFSIVIQLMGPLKVWMGFGFLLLLLSGHTMTDVDVRGLLPTLEVILT